MNPEAIKVGDKINIEAIVIRKLHSEEQLITCELPTGLQFHVFQRDFEALSPANGTKNAETAPKYDPCRKFRKGDKVRVVEWNGRKYYDLDHNTKLETGCCAEIWDDEENEQQEGYVSVIHQEYIRSVPPCFLELVTPVEEREPYIMLENAPSNSIEVRNKRTNKVEATFYFGKDHAYTFDQAATRAEAERDRLNAERKEQYEQAKSHE